MKIKEKVKQIWRDHGYVISTCLITGGGICLSYQIGKIVGINRYENALNKSVDEVNNTFSVKQRFHCPVNQLGEFGTAISKQFGNLDEDVVVNGIIGVEKK